MTEDEVSAAIRTLVEERDWDQFHSPENLAKSIVIEAAELLECFQWDTAPSVERVASELADVLTYCRLLAAKLDLNLNGIVVDKLEVTRAKYPMGKARGRSAKYDEL